MVIEEIIKVNLTTEERDTIVKFWSFLEDKEYSYEDIHQAMNALCREEEYIERPNYDIIIVK